VKRANEDDSGTFDRRGSAMPGGASTAQRRPAVVTGAASGKSMASTLLLQDDSELVEEENAGSGDAERKVLSISSLACESWSQINVTWWRQGVE